MRAGVPGMPINAKHLGEWRGEYIHLDAEGAVVDRHASHLKCWVPDDGSYDIVQINTYTWADGRVRALEFGGRLDERRKLGFRRTAPCTRHQSSISRVSRSFAIYNGARGPGLPTSTSWTRVGWITRPSAVARARRWGGRPCRRRARLPGRLRAGR